MGRGGGVSKRYGRLGRVRDRVWKERLIGDGMLRRDVIKIKDLWV